jgi:voltage-gated potassium channel
MFMDGTGESFVRRRISIIGGLLAAALVIGTFGYQIIEGWPTLDSFYMTVITLTTVGFGEIKTLSPPGRIFTVFLIAGGVGIVAYASTTAVQLLVSGELQKELLTRRRRRMLEKLQKHDVICGFGRMGQHVADELHRRGRSFVVIDNDEKQVEKCRQKGYHAVLGNAVNEEILLLAGIERAKSLITVVKADTENVFIVLTARALCPHLTIISRMNYDDTESKLRRAGADQVISPYVIGARRMASCVDRPGVADFLDVVMHSPELELWMEEFEIIEGSLLAGKSLRDTHLRSEIGVTVLSIRCPGKPVVIHPGADNILPVGARLIALGTGKQLNKLAKLAMPVKTTKFNYNA